MDVGLSATITKVFGHESHYLAHLVLSARRALAIVIVSFLHKSRSSAASLSFARFIPDIVCISSIVSTFRTRTRILHVPRLLKRRSPEPPLYPLHPPQNSSSSLLS